jgi:putative acetyltransferase
MHIRIATNIDRDDIHSVHWSAFAEGEREIVSKLAVNLISEETAPPIISLVAETEGAVVGHVAFSPVTIGSHKSFQGYILAPLGVKPDYQKRRIGSKLIESGVRQLSGMDVGILFVYGDPKYYSRFGFSVDAAERYVPPYELQYPFGWQGLALDECSAGKSPVKITCVTSLCDPTLW